MKAAGREWTFANGLSLLIQRVLLFAVLLNSWTLDGATSAWLTGPPVLEIGIELAPEGIHSLREHPRRSVPARVLVDGLILSNAAVHLKGRTGSFQTVDERASWTVDLATAAPVQSIRGAPRFHLNNSVEDPSLLCDWLGSELFREEGFPVPGVIHARVTLNGRPLGLYVCREGLSPEFLRNHGLEGSRIYEPPPGADVTDLLALKVGPEEAVRADRRTFAALAKDIAEADPSERWARLEHRLDLDSFFTLQALEILLAHRDGYGMARNNFRVLVEAGTDRIAILPYAMDQLFLPVDLPWDPLRAGAVARALSATQVGKERHEARCRELYAKWMAGDRLEKRIRGELAGLRPWLTSREANELEAEADRLWERIRMRLVSLESEFKSTPVPEVTFLDGKAELTGWEPADVPARGSADRRQDPQGIPCLRLVAGPVTFASWTTRVHLPEGRYRWSARARTEGVKPLSSGRHHGVSLRVSGDRPRSSGWTGDSNWRPLEVEFEVGPGGEDVRVFAELRASAGMAWFDLGSLRLFRIE